MHTCDKADDRGKSAQRYDTVAAPCRADPSAISGNLVWRLHSGAMQWRQLTTCLRLCVGTGTVRVLDFPLAGCVEGIGLLGRWSASIPRASDEGEGSK